MIKWKDSNDDQGPVRWLKLKVLVTKLLEANLSHLYHGRREPQFIQVVVSPQQTTTQMSGHIYMCLYIYRGTQIHIHKETKCNRKFK